MATTDKVENVLAPLAPPVGLPTDTRRESGFKLSLAAFVAILRRDIVVTTRDFIPFLLQTLVQPLFFLFIFGAVLPKIGLARAGFGSILFPGIVALTALTAALQGVTLPLVLDLGFAREIDDRLLSPLPVSMVAIEKIVFAAMRGMIAGIVIFPLARWILGTEYQVRSDRIGLLILILVLTALVGASFGMMIGTLIKPEQIGLMFALILTPLLFTGCTYYPWSLLSSLKWFQIVTLFNPLTYAAEGMRAAMVPAQKILVAGHVVTYTLPTLDTRWVLLALCGSIVFFTLLGLRNFHNRVIS
ncbi:MAG: ABC transporter permease [Ktedonobacterales bacterium]